MPMATSHCPWRQARPNESATTTAGPVGQGGAQRTRARVGVARQEDERAVLGGVGGVDAGVGAHEAVVGAADEHAALRAHDARRLVEDDLHVARVLGVLARELPGAVADDDVLERGAARPRPWRRPCGRRRGRRRARSRRRRAGRRGRRPGAPRAGRRAPTPAASSGPRGPPSWRRCALHGCRGGCRSSRASRPRVCAAPPVRASSAARRTARSSAVSTSSTSERGSATRQRAPLAPAACSWRSRLPGPKLGAIASGGASSRALVPGAVAVGDDDDVRGAHGAGHQLVDLARVERRAVAGHEQHALVVALDGPVDAGARRVRVAAVVVGDRLGVVGPGQRLGAVLAGDHDDLVDALGRGAARAGRR